MNVKKYYKAGILFHLCIFFYWLGKYLEMLSHLKSDYFWLFFRPNIPLEVKEAKCKKHCLFLLYQKLWPFQTLAQFMWSKQETGDLSTTIWCKIIDLRSNTGKTSPFHFWYFQYSKIKSPPGPICYDCWHLK